MAQSRFRRKEKLRKVYTFTRTKAVLGFFLSALFSIALSTLIDTYRDVIVEKAKSAVGVESEGESTSNSTFSKFKAELEARRRGEIRRVNANPTSDSEI